MAGATNSPNGTTGPRWARTRWSAAALALSLTLAACGADAEGGSAAPEKLDPHADLAKQSIVVSNWDGYMPKDVAATFKKSTGATMTVARHATNEEIVAKLTASSDPGIDVAFVSGQYAQALAEQGLLEPLHPELVPNLANLYPEASDFAYDKGNKYSVPYTWGTTGICYRSDLVKPAPTSWNDILAPKPEYSGKVTMLSTERWLALPALKSLGYSVNTKDDGELGKAESLLEKAKKSLLGYDNTTFYEKLISGEAVMAESWDGWCGYGTAENPDIKFLVPQEGSDLWVDTMVVLKSSKNKEAAFAFINQMLDPATHAWVSKNVYYNVPNAKAGALITPAEKKAAPTLAETPEQLVKGEGMVDLGEDSVKYTDLVTKVTSSS